VSKVSLNSPAPDFELADYTGQAVRLSDFQGKQNVLLVFNRGFT
jgi:peroxiredoxin